jgi:hypothetical protein
MTNNVSRKLPQLVVVLLAVFFLSAPGPAPQVVAGQGSAGRTPVSVLVLIDSRDAWAMTLGGPEEVILVHSPSMGTARTHACGGPAAEYPVQGVLLITPTTTYVTDVVVCRAKALKLGQTLNLTPAPSGEPSPRYWRFEANDSEMDARDRHRKG